MKYLIWLLIVLAGIWWIRKQRQPKPPQPPADTPTPTGAPTAMLPCAHCGVLCPENETVTGKHGRYCSDAHRQSHEG